MDRKVLSKYVAEKLKEHKSDLIQQFRDDRNIPFFYIDNLLPNEIAKEIFSAFPNISSFKQKNNMRERKSVGYQMDKYHPILEEIIYSFQESNVIEVIEEITGLKKLYPDDYLYAGGLSMMKKNDFLNPHLDNSHDKNRKRWRTLNLLYYVTPNWNLEDGGNLELWNHGLKESPLTIVSKFNRLVLMCTHYKSWHSVSKVEKEDTRCCVSNYYYSNTPINNEDSYHITTFRKNKGSFLLDYALQLDNRFRQLARKILSHKVLKNPHQYKKKSKNRID